VTLAGDSRVHVAVSAFSATVTLGTTTTVGAQRSALNVQLLLTVIFSFRHSFSRWSRSRPFVALYFTGRSTFLLHLMSPFLIVPVLSASDVIAFAVDLFVKPGFRQATTCQYVLYVSNYPSNMFTAYPGNRRYSMVRRAVSWRTRG
jgi:hypothetical protein